MTSYSILKMMSKYRKKYLAFLAMIVAIFATYEFYDSYVSSVEMEFYKTYFTSHSHDIGGTCKLPDYDPFDPTILKYIKKWPAIACGRTQLPLTYLDADGFVYINETALRRTKIPKKQFHCMFQEVKRTPNDDFHFELGPPEILIHKERIFSEFIIVQCYDHTRLVYESGHIQVPPPPPELDKSSKKALQDGGLNVLIMGLDSMSRLNFIRQLPKTYQVITQDYKSVVLKGLTKVGDNTFPNMMVMLSGLAAHNADETLGPFIGNWSANKGNFDDYPLIWKNFSAEGYVTMYTEDQPDINTFSYLAKGFFQPPTHYYTRPFWLALEKQHKFSSHDIRCYSHVPKHTILWNYTEEFVTKMHQGNNAFFAFSFLNILSHDKMNSVQVVDGQLSNFFKRLLASGVMNNTLLLLLGDHGNRFDDIRKTVIGRVEERMPFLAIHLPQKLEHLRQQVEENTRILTSWHDVYETLMDVVTKNLEPKSRQKELNPQETRVLEAGQTLISHVNDLLRPSANVCATLSLDTVVSAQILLPSGSVTKPSDFMVKLRVTVKTKPSGALLEATTERNAWDKLDRVVGDVNRINQYGNQSVCVHDKVLKLFCYCKTKSQ
ncbi:hypothetical protein B566_EDAN008438 [Ephemera danica]|nr:hypothetical protein B566_EDAN008438 [Ephemera danica]